jgi:ABC-type glutathione transport system ATPase component
MRARREDVILQVVDVCKSYGSRRARFQALAPMSAEFSRGQRTGVIGESGSGKSTLARLIVGLDRPSSGAVYWNGRDLAGLSPSERREFRRTVQLVGQDTTSSFDPLRSLRDSLMQPLRWLTPLRGTDANERIDSTLELLGIDPATSFRKPRDISGGQRQRYAIARALVVEPAILVCDEVISALDVSVQAAILNFLVSYCSTTGAGIVFISHGLAETAFVADELLVMRKGQVVEQGRPRELIAAPKHPYTKSLFEAAR